VVTIYGRVVLPSPLGTGHLFFESLETSLQATMLPPPSPPRPLFRNPILFAFLYWFLVIFRLFPLLGTELLLCFVGCLLFAIVSSSSITLVSHRNGFVLCLAVAIKPTVATIENRKVPPRWSECRPIPARDATRPLTRPKKTAHICEGIL
jgi:hypothetical protein